jgi:hypothetical protein
MSNDTEYNFETIISRLDDTTKSILKSIYTDNKDAAIKLAKRVIVVNHKIDNYNLQNKNTAKHN